MRVSLFATGGTFSGEEKRLIHFAPPAGPNKPPDAREGNKDNKVEAKKGATLEALDSAQARLDEVNQQASKLQQSLDALARVKQEIEGATPEKTKETLKKKGLPEDIDTKEKLDAHITKVQEELGKKPQEIAALTGEVETARGNIKGADKIALGNRELKNAPKDADGKPDLGKQIEAAMMMLEGLLELLEPIMEKWDKVFGKKTGGSNAPRNTPGGPNAPGGPGNQPGGGAEARNAPAGTADGVFKMLEDAQPRTEPIAQVAKPTNSKELKNQQQQLKTHYDTQVTAKNTELATKKGEVTGFETALKSAQDELVAAPDAEKGAKKIAVDNATTALERARVNVGKIERELVTAKDERDKADRNVKAIDAAEKQAKNDVENLNTALNNARTKLEKVKDLSPNAKKLLSLLEGVKACIWDESPAFVWLKKEGGNIQETEADLKGLDRPIPIDVDENSYIKNSQEFLAAIKQEAQALGTVAGVTTEEGGKKNFSSASLDQLRTFYTDGFTAKPREQRQAIAAEVNGKFREGVNDGNRGLLVAVLEKGVDKLPPQQAEAVAKLVQVLGIPTTFSDAAVGVTLGGAAAEDAKLTEALKSNKDKVNSSIKGAQASALDEWLGDNYPTITRDTWDKKPA